MLQLIVFNITNGLIIGAFYALMAIGLSLILNLSETGKRASVIVAFSTLCPHQGFPLVGCGKPRLRSPAP
jgi:hypothetical protein